MTDDSEGGALPSTEQWKYRFRHGVRQLARTAQRIQRLTLTEAPADINRPHLDYMLRPAHVRMIANAVGMLAEGLDRIEVHARHRHHRSADWSDLRTARTHLREAATALTALHDRNQGKRGAGQ